MSWREAALFGTSGKAAEGGAPSRPRLATTVAASTRQTIWILETNIGGGPPKENRRLHFRLWPWRFRQASLFYQEEITSWDREKQREPHQEKHDLIDDPKLAKAPGELSA